MAREMKNSGIEWIGDIPVGWSCNKVVRLFNLIGSGTTPKSDIDNNFIGNIHWIQSGDINGECLQDTKNMVSYEVVQKYSALKVYKAPFIVLAMYGASIGNISYSVIDGCVNQACCVLSNCCINSNYSFYVLKSAKDYLIFKGVGGGQPNISQETIKQLWIPLPNITEQNKIASFLDQKCAEIDAVIEKTKATIEEYKKLKQSVITEAVTKGIRGNRPMKDSGIEWIGEIPVGWDICKTLYALAMPITDGPHTTPELFDEGIPFVSAEAVSCSNGKINFNHIRGYISEDFYNECCLKYTPKINDIYMIKSGATTGRVSYVDTDIKFNIWSPLAVFRVNEKRTYFKYLFYYLQSDSYQKEVQLRWNYGTQQNIGMGTLETLKVLLPTINEQKEIADYLDQKCAEIDTLIAKKTTLLTELETYKKSLIYEYVTGKKEVN